MTLEPGTIEIYAELGTYVRKEDKVIQWNEDLEKLDKGLTELLGLLNERTGLRLRIKSDVPVGS